ncbi:TPA: hypothetical protein U0K44_000377 [Streptococcus suis]|nr:hypothetical protein [Streptococcus suis]
MSQKQVLDLLKMKEGIKTNKRDDYLESLIESSLDELGSVKGVRIDLNKMAHQTFVVDWTYYKYVNRDNPTMPRYLQQQLHDMQISSPLTKE